MPYCIADGFAQSMLCKSDSNARYVVVPITCTNTSTYVSASGTVTTELFTCSETWYYHITGDVYNSTSQWDSQVYLSGGTLISGNSDAHASNYNTVKIDCIYYVTAGSKVYMNGVRWSYGNGGGRNFAAELYRYYDLPHWEQFPVYPRELKEIWELASTTLYGRDVNWWYKGWIMLWTSTTATTWSITLWNAVWYITVSLNWNLVKIPYYN